MRIGVAPFMLSRGAMSVRPSSLLLPLVVFATVTACATSPSLPYGEPGDGPLRGEAVGQARGAILNGVRDTTHPAVVALALGKDAPQGTCTGTIVKVDEARRVGWVATAAHCVPDGVLRVIETEDFAASEGSTTYGVIDWAADPRYRSSGGGHDFAMVRITGVDERTPRLPLASDPDGLEVGMRVTSVGFGETHEGSNTKRWSIEKPIDSLTAELVGYDQRDRTGICYGDSGGPVIAGEGAAQRIVAIHSFGRGCEISAFSARVTDGLAFYEKELTKPLPAESCELCQQIAATGRGACAAVTTACLEDTECRAYQDCVAEGDKDRAECAAEFTLAEGPSLAATSCACGGPCAEVCAGSPSCAAAGLCGAKVDEEGACAACVESACCEEQRACTSDGRCHLCRTRDDTFPSCKKNAPRQALAACAADRCAEACAGSRIVRIGDEPPAAPAPSPPAADEDDGGCRAAPGRGVTAPGGLGAIAAFGLALAWRRRRRFS